ncbi:hypothetical protein [Thauera humireducens]
MKLLALALVALVIASPLRVALAADWQLVLVIATARWRSTAAAS